MARRGTHGCKQTAPVPYPTWMEGPNLLTYLPLNTTTHLQPPLEDLLAHIIWPNNYRYRPNNSTTPAHLELGLDYTKVWYSHGAGGEPEELDYYPSADQIFMNLSRQTNTEYRVPESARG